MFIICACLCSFTLQNSVFFGIDTCELGEVLTLAEASG
jgi:hypothetical protein